VTPTFWRGRRVFLTGHTGFKGSWLSLWLQRLGAELTGYALPPPTEPSLFDRADVTRGMTSVIGDIRDLGPLRDAMTAARPEIVVHMAAQPIVRDSYADPVGTYATNVMGTVHVLEALRAVPSARAAVIVTTDKVYRNEEWPWGYREGDRLGGHDPYSGSKAACELVVETYRSAFSSGPDAPAICAVRAGNVIGGGDWAKDRLIRDVVLAFAKGEPVTIRHPNATRPWQHVLDPLHGYLVVAERLVTDGARCARAYNLGPPDDSAQPVRHIVERLAALWGSGTWQADPGPHPHEAGLLKLDISLARAELGWRPRTDLDTALAWTVEWYRAFLGDPSSARRTTESQIARFEELAAA
jgi:CDP-glucose 4,6-dehydratase